MNQSLAMLAAHPKPRMLDMEVIKACEHRLDAIRVCVQCSRLSNETICGMLGLDNGHFTRMMQGRAHFPDAKANLLMEVCGNYAPLQYEAWSNGFELIEQSKDARIKELESLLKQLKEAA